MSGQSGRREILLSPWVLLSTAGLGTLLGWLLVGQALQPGFTDYWGFIVLQTAGTLALVLALSAWFAPEGGLSWYTHVVVTGNTWADALGTAGHLYERYSGYDKVTHFLAGVAITAAAADLLRALAARGSIRLGFGAQLVVALHLTLALNVGWELYEYLGDVVFHSERHRGGLDTAYDLVADMGGAFACAAFIRALPGARGAERGLDPLRDGGRQRPA